MASYNHWGNYNWGHHGGEWWHNGWNWGHYHYGGFWPYYWFPWFAFDWWPGYYYSMYYPYCYDYGPGDIYADNSTVAPYVAAYPPPGEQPAEVQPNRQRPNRRMPMPRRAAPGPRWATSIWPKPAGYFQQGNYRDAMRFAGHAAVEMPRSADVHNLLMLSMFAGGEYRGAAMEAHAAASLGQAPGLEHGLRVLRQYQAIYRSASGIGEVRLPARL